MLVRHLRAGPMTPVRNTYWHLVRLFTLLWHRLEVVGKHRVPHDGPVILAANHTTGLDPFVMQAMQPRMIRWVMLTSYKFPWAGFLWREIDPIFLDLDAGDTDKIRKIVDVLKEKQQPVGLFPEGALQREQRALQPFKPGVIVIARRAKAAVVPVWIEGTPERANMLLQFFTPSRTRVGYGEPYQIDRSQKVDAALAELRKRMLAVSREVAFRAADMACPACSAELTEAYAAGANECPRCGHTVWHKPAERETTVGEDGQPVEADGG